MKAKGARKTAAKCPFFARALQGESRNVQRHSQRGTGRTCPCRIATKKKLQTRAFSVFYSDIRLHRRIGPPITTNLCY